MNKLFEKDTIEEIANSIDELYSMLFEELNNKRERRDGYLLMNLMNLDKELVNRRADDIINKMKQLKALKPFNPKARY